MTERPLMRCGHRAGATRDGQPICAICAGDPKALEVADIPTQNTRAWGQKHYQEYLEKMKELKK